MPFRRRRQPPFPCQG